MDCHQVVTVDVENGNVEGAQGIGAVLQGHVCFAFDCLFHLCKNNISHTIPNSEVMVIDWEGNRLVGFGKNI